MWLLLLLLTIVVSLMTYLWLILPYNYWTRRGVPQGRPLPIFGDFWPIVCGRSAFADVVQASYNMTPQARFFGLYSFTAPSLLLRDPDLIKQITVKDFDHFVDRHPIFSEDVDPLWGKNLFALTGRKWEDMRSTFSPAFTGYKMKYVFELISESNKQFTKYFLNQDQEYVSIDVKDTFTRHINDVIGYAVFGVHCDSLEERENRFYRMGKEVTDVTGFWKSIKFLLHVLFPKLSKFTGVAVFSADASEFFHGLIEHIVQSREKLNIIRPDMIHWLLEARKSKSTDLPITDEDLTAQTLLFFFAGVETVSSQMSFTVYELAINPEIQEKLTQEIDETLEACEGTISYEVLSNMKYMGMVISESLRKWPATIAVDRICTKPYTIEPQTPMEVKVVLKPKDGIFLPIYGLHRDPQYYPDPDRFDPERFNDENKVKIKPFTYIPFGAGPRSCIGSRFALLEMKLLIFNLLKNFNIVPVEQTEIPLRLKKMGFTLAPVDKLWLGLKRRAPI